MPKIELVVFDMAGTTVRDEGEVKQCFFATIQNTDLNVDAPTINSMMGWPKRKVFEALWQQKLGADHPDYPAAVTTSYEKFKQILEHHYQTQGAQATEGCLAVFEWLKARSIKIALNTGFYREVTNIILDRLGWQQGLNDQYVGSDRSLIQASVTPSEIYQNEGRPAPFMIQKAMYRLGITDPQTVVHIGDTPTDLATGYNAHCLLSLGVTNGSHTRAELAAYPNSGLVDSLAELPAFLAAYMG
ncbi:HAD family hydrolase [Trichothermofontia sp.]